MVDPLAAGIWARLLGTGARLLGIGARLLGIGARLLGMGARLLGIGARLLGMGARLLGIGARLLGRRGGSWEVLAPIRRCSPPRRGRCRASVSKGEGSMEGLVSEEGGPAAQTSHQSNEV